jgi:hypothetical protein
MSKIINSFRVSPLRKFAIAQTNRNTMSHFVKRMETQQGFLNFYFNRIYTADGPRYHVSVIDRHRKSHIFHMVELRDEYYLLNKKSCPHWIATMESKFEEAILQHLTE